MTDRTYQSIRVVILLALALLFLQRLWSGTLYYYINQRFFSLVFLGALGFLLLAFVQLFGVWRSRSRQATEEGIDDHIPTDGHEHFHDHGDHDHSHPHLGSRIWPLIMVTVPVLLGLVIPASPLDANAVSVKGISPLGAMEARANPETTVLELPADDRTILDWLQAYNYAPDPTVLDGERADVVGFVYRDERLGQDEVLVGRFTLTCCVADAYAIGLVVRWPEAGNLASNTWVRAKGTIQISQEEGQEPMRLLADSVREVDPPRPTLSVPVIDESRPF